LDSAVKQEGPRSQELISETGLPASFPSLGRAGHARLPVFVNAQAVDPITKRSVSGTVTDLGAAGCFVETKQTLPVGAIVTVCFESVERTFQCRALVTEIVFKRGVGLTFLAADPTERISLLDWLGQLGGPRS
jgi:hypothetical protein